MCCKVLLLKFYYVVRAVFPLEVCIQELMMFSMKRRLVAGSDRILVMTVKQMHAYFVNQLSHILISIFLS